MKYEIRELRSQMIDENLGVYELLQELPAVDEFDQHNEYNGLSKDEVKKLINKKTQYAYGIGCDEDNPKCEHFVLFVDGKPCVLGCLMLEMTDFWKKHRGHIWFKTRPSERGKGFATKFLELAIERAKILGLKELLTQCNIHNICSNKVMQNNGFTKYTNPLCPDRKDTNFYKKQL